MNKTQVAQVVLESTVFDFDKPYSYAVPQHFSLSAGCRVVVPFGRGNSLRQGVVLEIAEENAENLKSICAVIDETPILNDEMLKLCVWLHENTFCTYFDAVRTVLPVGINLKTDETYAVLGDNNGLSDDENAVLTIIKTRSTITKSQILSNNPAHLAAINSLVKKGVIEPQNSLTRQVSEARLKSARLIVEEAQLSSFKLTPKQNEVVELLLKEGPLSVKEITYFTGASVSVVEALERKKVLETFQKDVYRTPYRFEGTGEATEISLTNEQNEAFCRIADSQNEERQKPWLIYGITGSGKTQVYLKLVDSALNQGKGVIIMVPEISLTPQTIEIFGKRYGSKIAVFHSAMSMGQRMDEWRRVNSGEAVIAVGTRSAVFAPVKNLGLIIMDEEQEHTYKSESAPRFHARDVARFRAAYNGAGLVLASATPSLETFAAARAGFYNLATLKNRFGNAVLPEVITVDMRSQILNGNTSALSTELKNALTETIKKGKQAILLLNRRGHNTAITCSSCGEVVTCPNCSISMTYHSANNRLMCHYCGHSIPADSTCPKCSGKHLKFMGVGTQKVEQELEEIFENVSILRLDADTTAARNSFDEKLAAFSRGEYQIMLGTQMVAKGLNFPNVTLVGVLGIDSAMYSEDFRSFERTFSLLTQVVGRAGRGNDKGTAIIQTLHPEANVIRLAAAQDYEAFYGEEILTRKLMIYPPYCDIVLVGTSSAVRENAAQAIGNVFDNIKNLLSNGYEDVKLVILGPAPAMVSRINNRYRYRMIIKTKNSKKFREMLHKAVNVKKSSDTSVFVDINPESII